MFYRACFIGLFAGIIMVQPVKQLSAQSLSPPQQEELTVLSSQVTPSADKLEQLDEVLEGTGEEKSYLFPVIFNGTVENHIEHFKTRGRTMFQQWLNLSTTYMPLVKTILREHNLPEDLAYVAMIESGFRPDAVSRKNAAGLWQIMPATGRKYGLRIDQWVDERKDPVKSTYAAAGYLKDLHLRFGSWPLVLASYNAGAGNVRRAVRKTRSTDFWDLNASPRFWRETRNYVPKYMAAVIIAKNPGAYGFTVPNTPAFQYDEVVVRKSTDLRLIARQARCTYKEILALNPEIQQAITPPFSDSYTIRVPSGRKHIFLANGRTIFAEPKRGIVRNKRATDFIPDSTELGTRPLTSVAEFIPPPVAFVSSHDQAILRLRFSKRIKAFLRTDTRRNGPKIIGNVVKWRPEKPTLSQQLRIKDVG